MTDQQPDNSLPPTEAVERYFYPNRMGRILMLAFEEVLTHNGLHALLKLGGHEKLATAPPPGNSDRQFPFEVTGGLTGALYDMYGPRSARGIATRVGRVSFKYGLRDYGPMLGIAELTFRLLPLSIKMEKGARAFAELFNHYSDQVVRLQETPDTLFWHIERCPVCWGVKSEQPCCHIAVGLLQESLMWLSGGRTFDVEEQSCKAMGDETCTIAISKTPLD